MYHRYKTRRKNSNNRLPMVAIGLTITGLILWGVYSKGTDVINFFKGETIIRYSNEEANENLTRLLGDLAGDKAKLLELAENSQTRLAWIINDDTRRQFRWFLLTRLVDQGLWTEAKAILPEVETLAPVEGLDRLADAAMEFQDYDLQLRMERQLQDRIVSNPLLTTMLLRSIRRASETCIRMNKTDEAVKFISRLDAPDVFARITSPELAAEAAELQMKRAQVSAVKEPVLQIVRNILEQGKWPLCPATSSLMLEEVSNALRDNPNLSPPALKEIEEKLLRCRDSMLEYPDREHRLPMCYTMLGELRYRLNNYEGCAQALSLAEAFAEGYGEMTSEMRLKLTRIRARANEQRGATGEAIGDYRYLAEHETEPKEVLTALSFLAANTQGEEQITLLTQCWDMLGKDEQLAKDNADFKTKIARDLAEYYKNRQDYPNAVKWLAECTTMAEVAFPDRSDGKAFRAGLELALVSRLAERDTAARNRLKAIMTAIEEMPEEERTRLDAADKELYRTVVREYARTCLLSGDTWYAKEAVKKIREGLPTKHR